MFAMKYTVSDRRKFRRFYADNEFPGNYHAAVINRLMHLDDTWW